MKNLNVPLILKALFLASFVLITLNISAQAVSLASWNPLSVSGYGPSPWNSATSHTDISVGGWTRGSGVGTSGTAAGNAWGGNNWGGGNTQDATFTITSNPGSTVSYSVFNMSYRRSGTGPGSGTFEYTFGNSTTYTVISSISFGSTSTGGVPIPPINLSTVADLQNVPAGTVVKFRILPTGGGSAGTWYINGAGAAITGVLSSFNLNISQTSQLTCNAQATTTLIANAVGSTGPYTYSWMPSGGSASVATGLGAGVYTCIVTSSSSETTSTTYTIAQAAILSSSVTTQVDVTCPGGSDGSATVTVSGGTPNYTLNWLPVGGTNSVVNNLAAGNYTLNILDSNLCQGTVTLSIAEPGPFLTANATNSIICQGATVAVTATGANSYTWSGGVLNGTAFSPTTSSSYTVVGTNTNNCLDTAFVFITISPKPTLSVTSQNTQLCRGETTKLTASGAVSYSWSTNTNSASIIISPTITTTYSLTGINEQGCINTYSFSQKVSGCTAIASLDAYLQNSVEVFPNPNAGEFFVRASSENNLVIINALGQTVDVLNFSRSNKNEIQIRNLKSGLYFIITEDKKLVKKVIVSN